MRKEAVHFYLEPMKNTIIRNMAKKYKVSLSSLFVQAVDLIIKNKEKLDEIYLPKENKCQK